MPRTPGELVRFPPLPGVPKPPRSRLDPRQERWDEDVFAWLRTAVRAWVQRCKMMTFRPRPEGIHVRLETQDDHGYYVYELDVFPGRGADAHPTSRRRPSRRE